MHPMSNANQVEMFRTFGLSKLDVILLALSKDPAMIFWLDNSENHGDEINENYGRELLELFSMGVGNYTEDDIKNCARAFTGWTFTQPIPIYPQGDFPSYFHYREDDHDSSVKTFLGETGQFDGADIINIIIKQPATAKFVSRHLYNFFVADEPQVPAWDDLPPQNPEAIDMLSKAFKDSQGDMRSVLRVLFNSEFFKQAQFKRVKCPAELVAGVIKLTGTNREPNKQLEAIGVATAAMGQELYNPPTVEGWHTGKEWIDSGTLVERINFVADQVGNIELPGVKDLLTRMAENGTQTPQQLVDGCLDLLGPVQVMDKTYTQLLAHANQEGNLDRGTADGCNQFDRRVSEMFQLIVATGEYQFG